MVYTNFSNISFKSEINQINRYQGTRLNSVKAAVYPGRLASSVLKDVEAELKEFEDSLHPGYSIKQFGDADERAESFGQLFSTFFLFLGLIVITLVMILNSFYQAAVILFVGLLCIGLGFLGMFLGFQNFGFSVVLMVLPLSVSLYACLYVLGFSRACPPCFCLTPCTQRPRTTNARSCDPQKTT